MLEGDIEEMETDRQTDTEMIFFVTLVNLFHVSQNLAKFLKQLSVYFLQ